MSPKPSGWTCSLCGEHGTGPTPADAFRDLEAHYADAHEHDFAREAHLRGKR